MSNLAQTPAGRWCDNCGRQVDKMHRLHKGKGYCAGCYASEFKPVPCTGCPGTARMHKRDSSVPLCGTCQRAGRACIRCGAPVPTAGKKVGDGAVACPSCAPHFRDKEPCWECGRESSRLVWSGEGDILTRVCQPCSNVATHATCIYCRRHRLVAGRTDAGRAFCAQCGPSGEAWRCCPGCKQVVQGAGNGRCRSCITRDVLRREAQLIAVTLKGAWVVSLLNGFVGWLLERQSDHPQLPRVLRSHLPFFSSLDEGFSAQEHVVPQSLLDHFTAAGLRRHQLAARYTCDVLGVVITEEDKQEHVESARVAEILEKAQSAKWSDDLFHYNLWLIKADRPVRTRRLYLSAAAGLIRSAGVRCLLELNQQSLEQHIEMVPGTRASLSSVVRFARETLSHNIALPPRPAREAAEPRPVRRLRALLKAIENDGDRAAIDDLEGVISIALQIPLRSIRGKKWWPEKRGKRWHVVSKTEAIPCPSALQDVMSRWAHKQAKT